jgi:hypothetical protein
MRGSASLALPKGKKAGRQGGSKLVLLLCGLSSCGWCSATHAIRYAAV